MGYFLGHAFKTKMIIHAFVLARLLRMIDGHVDVLAGPLSARGNHSGLVLKAGIRKVGSELNDTSPSPFVKPMLKNSSLTLLIITQFSKEPIHQKGAWIGCIRLGA